MTTVQARSANFAKIYAQHAQPSQYVHHVSPSTHNSGHYRPEVVAVSQDTTKTGQIQSAKPAIIPVKHVQDLCKTIVTSVR
jgi:hypothetical protein